MNPRGFLNFFKTKTGRLVLFVAIFGGGMTLFGVFRRRDEPMRAEPLPVSLTNEAPQTVQTVQRPMEVFRPPAPKPDLPPARVVERAKPLADLPKPAVVQAPSSPPPPPPAPSLSLVADGEANVPEPKVVGVDYAPYGRLIPCETVITVDSTVVQAPIIGLVTEDVYHAGRVIIPAGTEVHGTSRTERHRERISSGSSWTLVWQTGEEMRLKGVVLDREFSSDQEGWGITDGSAGLRGRLIKSDNLAEIKLFAATLLSGAAGAMTEKEMTLLGSIDSRSLNNAPLKGAQEILKVYSQRILETIERDGFYVRVPSGKQFYLYVLQTLDRSEAVIGGNGKPFADETETEGPLASTVAVATPGPSGNPARAEGIGANGPTGPSAASAEIVRSPVSPK